MDRAWRTAQLSSNQADLRAGRDQLAELCYFSPCPGAARRPWSCHLPKSLNESANLIAINRPPQAGISLAGISTTSAEELLGRMQTKVDGLCAERDRLIGEQRRKYPGTNKVINGPIERRFR
jgi:hypothetical protein